MNVFQCVVWGVTPEENISNDLVKFVEKKFRTKNGFNLKSVVENTNPARITKSILGYYPPYGVAYISNPDRTNGLNGIDFDNKRIIIDSNAIPFFEHRDAIVYFSVFNTYIREGFNEVMNEFEKNGFGFYEFAPKSIGDSLIRYCSPSNIPFGKQIKLENI